MTISTAEKIYRSRVRICASIAEFVAGGCLVSANRVAVIIEQRGAMLCPVVIGRTGGVLCAVGYKAPAKRVRLTKEQQQDDVEIALHFYAKTLEWTVPEVRSLLHGFVEANMTTPDPFKRLGGDIRRWVVKEGFLI